jgi:hypothetical protein
MLNLFIALCLVIHKGCRLKASSVMYHNHCVTGVHVRYAVSIYPCQVDGTSRSGVTQRGKHQIYTRYTQLKQRSHHTKLSKYEYQSPDGLSPILLGSLHITLQAMTRFPRLHDPKTPVMKSPFPHYKDATDRPCQLPFVQGAEKPGWGIC